MHLCMYASTFLCINVSVRTRIYVSMYNLCVCVPMYLYIYVSMHLCIYVSICTCICLYAYACTSLVWARALVHSRSLAMSTVTYTYVSSQNCIQAHIHSANILPHIKVYFSERLNCATRVMSRSRRLASNFPRNKNKTWPNSFLVFRTIDLGGEEWASSLLGGTAVPCTWPGGRPVDTCSGARHLHWTDF